MRRRIFIAINLPEEIKKELSSFQGRWPELPVRWVKKNNLHITLVFLGYLRDEELVRVCEDCRRVACQTPPFLIWLKRVCYGPPGQPPRMIWVEGARSEELEKLQRNLEKSLVSSKISFEPETRTFKPHITLGRLRQWEFRRIEPEERPIIDEEIDLGIEVKSIEVMESQLKRGGAEYTNLESIPLSK